jgi:N-acetylglucosamine-6-phosphate deacetylase
MAFALKAARIYDGAVMRENFAVIVNGDKIIEVLPAAKVPKDMTVEDLGGGILAPGFIDVQVNGGGGALMNDNPTLDTVKRIAESHRKFGTTGLLPTVITDDQKVIDQAVSAVQAAIKNKMPGILGIHMEGPFLDVTRKGAHPAHFIRAITESDVRRIADIKCGVVMLTLAPNRVPPGFIAELSKNGVLISLGHAEATIGDVQPALDAGASAFTHIYNAMSQLTGREPGMVGACLGDPTSFCGVIVDGLHVSEVALKVLFAAKPKNRIMLITDAMPPAAGGPDRFELQGRVAHRMGNKLQLQDGTLAGSIVTMDEAVRRSVELGVGLEDALRMASTIPAHFLHKENELGRIAQGFKASMVHLSDDLHVTKTWIDGR